MYWEVIKPYPKEGTLSSALTGEFQTLMDLCNRRPLKPSYDACKIALFLKLFLFNLKVVHQFIVSSVIWLTIRVLPRFTCT